MHTVAHGSTDILIVNTKSPYSNVVRYLYRLKSGNGNEVQVTSQYIMTRQ